MARPERNNVDYFPHPVSHGRKMFYLRSKYKNDGYTVWFMLLEQIGKADYHFLDLADETQMMYLSCEFMVSEETLIEIIELLLKLGEFDSELWEQKILYSQKFIDSISDAYKKRNNNCVDKNSLITLLISKGRLIDSSGNRKEGIGKSEGHRNKQIITKDIKLKDMIEYFGIEVDEKLYPIINQWLKYKSERHEICKEQSIRAFINQLKRFSDGDPLVAQNIINQSMANNWAGIFELKNNHKPVAIVQHDSDFD
jgi:hypothetical protein